MRKPGEFPSSWFTTRYFRMIIRIQAGSHLHVEKNRPVSWLPVIPSSHLNANHQKKFTDGTSNIGHVLWLEFSIDSPCKFQTWLSGRSRYSNSWGVVIDYTCLHFHGGHLDQRGWTFRFFVQKLILPLVNHLSREKTRMSWPWPCFFLLPKRAISKPSHKPCSSNKSFCTWSHDSKSLAWGWEVMGGRRGVGYQIILDLTKDRMGSWLTPGEEVNEEVQEVNFQKATSLTAALKKNG